MENNAEPAVRAFFEMFEKKTAAGDSEGLAGLYAASFLLAGVNGSQVAKASDLLLAIPKRKEIFNAIGCQATTLVSLHQTKLDDRYSLVRTQWRWRFVQGSSDREEITLPSTYVIESSPVGLRIVFYLAHADIMAVLRDRGLLPPSTTK